MDKKTRDRVVALAAMFQAAWLTDRLAHTGRADEAALDASLGSLLEFEPESVPDIYKGVQSLRPGLELVDRVLGNRGEEDDLRVTRYLVSLIGHANRLLKDSDMAGNLRRRLERSAQQKSHFEGWGDPVIAGLAENYVATIGQFEPRIMVKGDPQLLQNPRVVESVRATLLAGIRAAVLWRQLGGRRWQLVFRRKPILATASYMLESGNGGEHP